jgi:hypothetical protein
MGKTVTIPASRGQRGVGAGCQRSPRSLVHKTENQREIVNGVRTLGSLEDLLKFSTQYWSTRACVEANKPQRNNHLKELEGLVLHTHAEPEMVPISSIQIEELRNSIGFGNRLWRVLLSSRKELFQMMGRSDPFWYIVKAMSCPMNKFHWFNKFSQCLSCTFHSMPAYECKRKLAKTGCTHCMIQFV